MSEGEVEKIDDEARRAGAVEIGWSPPDPHGWEFPPRVGGGSPPVSNGIDTGWRRIRRSSCSRARPIA